MLNNLGTIDTGLTLLAQQLVFYVKKILINYFLFQANALWQNMLIVYVNIDFVFMLLANHTFHFTIVAMK